MPTTPRERVLAVVDHRPVDRIPLDYWATGEVTARLQRHFCVDDPMALWDHLHVDKIVGVAPRYIGPPRPDDPDGVRTDYWGVRRRPVRYATRRPGHNGPEAQEAEWEAGRASGAAWDTQRTGQEATAPDAGAVYYEICQNPLARFQTIEEIERHYVWPSADWFDYSNVAEACARCPDHAVMAGYAAPFCMFNNVRGLEASLLDLAGDPELAAYCVERICDFLYAYHARLFEAGRGRIDLTQVTDDFGGQAGPLISLAMFRRYFARPYARLISLAKQFGLRVFHHDDGAMREFLPDLVDLGVDVLNPVQWRLPGMALVPLKRDFGARLCFHGGVDNQWVLPFGTSADVQREVRACLSALASDGTGYILAPCHNLQPITPLANILTLYETAYEEAPAAARQR